MDTEETRHKRKTRFGPDYEEKDCGYSTPCWVWLKGYSEGFPLKYRGATAKISAAKYYYVEVAKRPLYPAQILYRECANKTCVNPDHMTPKGHKAHGKSQAKRQIQKLKEKRLAEKAEEKAQRKQLRQELAEVRKQIREQNRPTPPKRTGPSRLYFLRSGEDGPIKIGISKDVEARLRHLQCAHHTPLKILKVVEGDRDMERNLLMRFQWARSHGEWFHPAPELLDLIDSLEQAPL